MTLHHPRGHRRLRTEPRPPSPCALQIASAHGYALLLACSPLAALERLCKANGLVTSGKKYELLTRLVNAEKHGRAKPCPHCKANLHLVCTPSELQPNEVTQLVCRHWNYRGGKREPCGYKVGITPQNRAAQLCLRLVDSPERDLAAVAELAKAVEHLEGEAEGGEGGEVATAAEQPWAPKDTEELLQAIATKDYAISDDRSWSTAYPKAFKIYNKEADSYHQTLQKHGQPLHEGFWVVKVRPQHACLARSLEVAAASRDCNLAHPAQSPAYVYLARSPEEAAAS